MCCRPACKTAVFQLVFLLFLVFFGFYKFLVALSVDDGKLGWSARVSRAKHNSGDHSWGGPRSPEKSQIGGIMATRRVHEENKGLTIVAKPGFQFVVFLVAVVAVALLLVGVNLVIASTG